MTRTVWMMWIVTLALAIGCEEPKPEDGDGAADLTADTAAGTGDSGIAVESAVIGVEEGVLLTGYDSLTFPGRNTPLVARLARAADLKPIGGVTVSFYQDGANFIGAAVTDDRGYAHIEIMPTRVGDYRFTVQITEMPSFLPASWLTVSAAPLLVAARDSETPMAVVDLDRTVAESDFVQAVADQAKPTVDCRAVLARLAARYSLVYAVDHPQAMSGQAKRWLSERGFQSAPLLLASGDPQAGDSDADTLRHVRDLQATYPQVELLITGNLPDAAGESSLTTFWLVQVSQDPTALRALADQISDPWTLGQAQVVTDWLQIQVSVFHGVRHPPLELAERLRRLADEMENRP